MNGIDVGIDRLTIDPDVTRVMTGPEYGDYHRVLTWQRAAAARAAEPGTLLLTVTAMTALYVVATEITKRRSYRVVLWYSRDFTAGYTDVVHYGTDAVRVRSYRQ